ncbi:MAG TPA: mycothiol synthase [Actinomycetales bacterium]|nr:mycothiol synthase [Actinomycetales bacterium]
MCAAVMIQTLHQLSRSTVHEVLALADAAERADDVRPINEATELRLRSATAGETGGEQPGVTDVVHVIATDDDGATHGYAQVSGAAGGTPELELAVHPDHRRRGTGRALLRKARDVVRGKTLRGWAHGDLPGARALAAAEGFEPVRGLLKMRLDLAGAELPDVEIPVGVRIRGFERGHDEEAWLRVNSRAFATHPEQGRWTRADLDARMATPWFDPAGFLMAVDEASGELLGYHWTKVEDHIGEVYVVGVDPAAQGRRLGSVLTLAGLHHLEAVGVPVVDLYVDSDNEPALKVYMRLGFERSALDVMYESL